MGRLSRYERNRIVTLRKQFPRIIDLHQALRLEDIEISRQGLNTFLTKFQNTGSIADRPRCGRTPLLSDEHKNFIDTCLQENREHSAKDVQRLIFRTSNVLVSVDTIKRARRMMGWVYTGTRYCQMVRNVNKPLRQAFCLECLGNAEDFRDVIFSDESSIVLSSSLKKCFRKKNEPRQLIAKPKHPTKVHVWAGISARGATQICIFQGIMDTDFYLNILTNYLLPFIRHVYPDTHRFQQDNDPKHTARATLAWFEENGVNYWPTPPESPDLNPIENFWAALKYYINKKAKPTTQDALVRSIQDFWHTVTPDVCQRYISHLHKVMPVVVAREGGPSGY